MVRMRRPWESSPCGGGGAEIRSRVTTTTGQQLIDLTKALDAGGIAKDTYEKERNTFLEQ